MQVPAQYYPWALLLLWQLLMPGVSFLGHLAGVLVGAMHCARAAEVLIGASRRRNKQWQLGNLGTQQVEAEHIVGGFGLMNCS